MSKPPVDILSKTYGERVVAPFLLVRLQMTIGEYAKTEVCQVPEIRNFPELLAKLNSERFIALIMENDWAPTYVNTSCIAVIEEVGVREGGL